jgi:hypothetical protein
MGTRPGKGSVSAALLGCLTTLEKNEVFSMDYLCEALSLTQGQVQTGMYRLLRAEKWPVEIIAAGRLWRNLAEPTHSPAAAEAEPEPAMLVEVIEDHDVFKVLNIDGFVYLARRVGLAGE